jgi:5-methylcytosine-specific restriction endonuclease McrA
MHQITIDQRKKDVQRFAGLRYIVLKRDEYKCVGCGMSQDEHIKRWGKSLTINHINGIGRNHRKPDNRLSNLETLCLKCHGHKDGPRWMTK